MTTMWVDERGIGEHTKMADTPGSFVRSGDNLTLKPLPRSHHSPPRHRHRLSSTLQHAHAHTARGTVDVARRRISHSPHTTRCATHTVGVCIL